MKKYIQPLNLRLPRQTGRLKMKKFKDIERKVQGSLTVEAALVMPMFIYAVIAFVYFLQIIGLQEHLQNAITETGYFAAKYAYVYDYLMYYEETKTGEENVKSGKENTDKGKIKEGIESIIAHSIDSTFYKNKMKEFLDIEEINQSCIKDGYNGVHTYLSSYMQEEDAVDIILIYKIKIPLVFFSLKDMQMVQRVRLRGWNGHRVAAKNDGKNAAGDTTEEDKNIVYITETGRVYHLSKECTHLKLSIQSIKYSQIEISRNVNGGKYHKCFLCCEDNISLNHQVYITNTGDRYHQNLNCSGLKRTIIAIPISKIGNRSLCKRCNK